MPVSIADQIAALNPQPGERFSVNHMQRHGPMKSVVRPAEAIPGYVNDLPMEADIWIGVNPVADSVPPSGRRGNASEITRLAALFADLDVKEGGCSDYGQALSIVYSLSDIIGTEPTLLVYSGHGIQPYWPVDPSETLPNAELGALLARWGVLVRRVANSVGAQVDSVFDLPRILRAVGTLNNKRMHVDGFAVGVTAEEGGGGPVSLSAIAERLDEYGVPEVNSVGDFSGKSDPSVWVAASSDCRYAKAAVSAWATDKPGGNGRHPWMHGKAIRLAAFQRNGCLTFDSVRHAEMILRTRFEALCASGIGGDPRSARRGEFDESMRDARAYVAMMSDARLVAEVSHLHGIETPSGAAAPPPMDVRSAQGHSEAITGHQGADGMHAAIFEAEGDFWSSRDSLKLIYEVSLARMCSPWAVLGYSAARALALVPPDVKLPRLIGGQGGSLNWFAALSDRSGGGKSSAASVAKELVAPPHPMPGTALVPEPMVYEANVGSGEGMIGQFYRPPEKKGDPPRTRTSVMFIADEVDNLTAMGQRQGSTTLPMIRTAFTGGRIGFSYITKGRDVHIPDHTYRMTMVVNVQPARTGALFNDAGGGTPQRFMWFPANDPRISVERADDEDWWPSVSLPEGMALASNYPLIRGFLGIPGEARELILTERAKAAQGNEEALDGHAIFCREKFAYSLALLEGRMGMNSDDWRLSGIAAEVSARTRDWTRAALDESLVDVAREDGRIRGVVAHAANDERAHQDSLKAERVRSRVLAKLKADGPLSQRRLGKFLGRDYTWLPTALESLSSSGVIYLDDESRWAVMPSS